MIHQKILIPEERIGVKEDGSVRVHVASANNQYMKEIAREVVPIQQTWFIEKIVIHYTNEAPKKKKSEKITTIKDFLDDYFSNNMLMTEKQWKTFRRVFEDD